MKFGLKHYYKPTPKKVRKIGDTLLGVSTFICGYAITADIKWVAVTGLVIGVAGKLFTNFFSNEDEPAKD